jgi:hypothetical protein
MNVDATEAPTSRLVMRWMTKNSNSIWSFFAVVFNIAALDRIAGLAGLIVFIGCFMVLRESKKAWHDDWAGTAVYRPPREKRGFEPIMGTPMTAVPGGEEGV